MEGVLGHQMDFLSEFVMQEMCLLCIFFKIMVFCIQYRNQIQELLLFFLEIIFLRFLITALILLDCLESKLNVILLCMKFVY